MGHFLLDAADRFIAEIAQDAVGRNVVVAVVGGVGDFDFDIKVGQLGLDDLGDVDHLVVFEAEIEGAAVDFSGRRLDEQTIEIDHVGHADIRSALLVRRAR